MKRRQEKGLIILLIIIIACLFLMTVTGGPSFLSKSTGEIKEEAGHVPDNDIAVTDSFEMQEREKEQESMEELTFLIDNFSFERGGSQILIGIVAGLLLLYLILIGPVAYFYLKRIRKMERMWILLPVVSLIFGCIILLMSNDFIIREPYVDLIKVISPVENTVCYGVVTSPGEDSYSLYFEDTVKSLQTWAAADNYSINEERRSITFRPDSAFEKDYFQFYMNEIQNNDFVHSIQIKGQTGTGTLYNTTGYLFSHVMLCYEDRYCILPVMHPGDVIEVTEDMWKKDEYGMSGSLKEELQIQSDLTIDEKEIFHLAWYKHWNSNSHRIHIAGISKEGNTGLKNAGVDMIFYSLFYR